MSSEEFSFPALASQDSSHYSGLDSPPLWKHSPESLRREDYNRDFARLINDQRKSFSYVETRSLWNNGEDEKMDMLWEDLNEELQPRRSQSMRIETGGGGEETKKQIVFPDESSAVVVGCGMGLSKKTSQKKKRSLNVLMLMRVLKKLLVLRSLSQRSPAKTHPR